VCDVSCTFFDLYIKKKQKDVRFSTTNTHVSDPRDHNSCCSFLGVRCELASDSTAASDVRLIGPVRDEASGS
jgi:hypothetical protein